MQQQSPCARASLDGRAEDGREFAAAAAERVPIGAKKKSGGRTPEEGAEAVDPADKGPLQQSRHRRATDGAQL